MERPLKVRLRKAGILLIIENLPRDLVHYLGGKFTYERVVFNRERHRRVSVKTRTVRLWRIDRFGSFVTGIGFLNRVKEILSGRGISFEVVDEQVPEFPLPDFSLVKSMMTLRPGQADLLVAVASHERGLVKCPPAFGKSQMIAAICLMYPKTRIVVTAVRTDVVRTLVRMIGDFGVDVGQLGAGKRDIDHRVVVSTARSLHHLPADRFSLLLVDEVHEFAAPTYMSALSAFGHCRAFGFSATPEGRFDNADIELECFFGPVIYERSFEDSEKLGVVVPIKVFWVDVPPIDTYVRPDYEDIVEYKRHAIWTNDHRNRIIAAAARVFDRENQIMITVEKVEHAVHLKRFLPDYVLVFGSVSERSLKRILRADLIDRDELIASVRKRAEYLKEFEAGELRKVIATDVWSTGVSFEKLSVVVRADAGVSEIKNVQIPGRVCRVSGEKKYGVLVDFTDRFDPRMAARARIRRRVYENQGWQQDELRNLSSLPRGSG